MAIRIELETIEVDRTLNATINTRNMQRKHWNLKRAADNRQNQHVSCHLSQEMKAIILIETRIIIRMNLTGTLWNQLKSVLLLWSPVADAGFLKKGEADWTAGDKGRIESAHGHRPAGDYTALLFGKGEAAAPSALPLNPPLMIALTQTELSKFLDLTA